ncbi:hypothetical protein [Mariniphaga sp.]|uniref:hypothetical protein n=1 Tax=Mariniphaga sp. TaxID=1954475 RepID=UPI003565E202
MKHTYLILILLAMALFSCDQENMGTLYEPDAPYVAFSSPVVSGNVLSAENDYAVRVQVVRSELSGSATATVSLEMNENIEGVFDLESNTVTFEDGKGSAYLKIVPLVEPGQIDPTKNYVFNLTLTGDNASEFYNKTSYRASFRYTPIGTGTFTSVFFDDEWPVDLEKLEVGNLTLYKAKALYETGYDITIVVEGENVTVNDQAAWYYDDEYGEVFITGTGTINGKTITMSLTHFIPDVYAWDPETEVLTLP